MPARDLPSRPNLEQYKKQAKDLLKQWKAAAQQTVRKLADAQHAIAREYGFETWKRFTDEIARRTYAAELLAIWKAGEDAIVAGDDQMLERLLREHEKMLRTQRPRSTWLGGLAPQYRDGDARTIIAREHYFETWDAYAAFAQDAKLASSLTARFEAAVDAVVAGDADTLGRMLRTDPWLVHARSARTHHSQLLHYVGSNGVESWRQRTPKNIVDIAALLLDAGAEVDATADMYGGGCTTLGLAATSIHPKRAGVLEPLLEFLISRGAHSDARAGGNDYLIVNSCLANARPEAADYLARHGAPLDLEGAAGVGRLDLVKAFFNPDGSLTAGATSSQLKDGFTWACEFGKTDVVEFLLDHGVSASEILPRHHRQTGLHWAALGAHIETVKALLRRGAPLDVRDASFNNTPLGWALHGWRENREGDAAKLEPYYDVVALLVSAGSPVEPAWLSEENEQADPRMAAALKSRTA